MIRIAGCLLAAAAITRPATGGGTTLRLETVASGLNRPVYCTAPPGDTTRLFVVEKRGVVRILRLDDLTLASDPFLDITSLVADIFGDNDERGLLGMAFHPDYAENGLFYVYYIDDSDFPGDTVIARYSVSADPDHADPGSALIIKTFDQPDANHNGGCLQFGPDGMLYVSSGDGGGQNDQHGPFGNGQAMDTLLGKLLRLDVDAQPPYVPPTNPFVDQRGALGEIWSFGLRNPWRFSFDRATGDLYLTDVGQFEWEELNYRPAGTSHPSPDRRTAGCPTLSRGGGRNGMGGRWSPDAGATSGGENYGWRCMEGNHCFISPSGPQCTCFEPNLIIPVYEYHHSMSPLRCSITGGYVYRGSDIPCEDGNYFFADWCSGETWSLRIVDGAVQTVANRTPELGAVPGVVSFGEDARGELYMVRQSGSADGAIYRIVAAEPCPDPCTGGTPDCNQNGVADDCDIADGTSTDCNGNAVPDECDTSPCADDAICGDCDVCTHATCDQGTCVNTPSAYGDANGDGLIDIFDIFCVLDGFQNVFDRCAFADVDIAGCTGDGTIDILDIFAVLDAFQGLDPCCGG